MRRTIFVLVIILLSICVCFCLLGVLDTENTSSPTEPKENQPQATTDNTENAVEYMQPDNELPPISGGDFDDEPECTEPSETISPTTLPPITEPAITEPPVTEPAETLPLVTDPPIVEPSTTEPTEQPNDGDELPSFSDGNSFE